MINWFLFIFLVASPTIICAEIETGYDGAGNYIEEALIDEKKTTISARS